MSRPVRRTIILVLISLAIVVALVALALLALRASRPNVLPGVVLAGTDVGGMTRAELTSTVRRLADAKERDPVTVTLRDNRRTATNADLGYAVDRSATVEQIWAEGRSANPLGALGDHVRATFGETEVTLTGAVDDQQLGRWARRTTDELAIAPVEGNVALDGAKIRRRDPRQGLRPVPSSLEQSGRAAIDAPGADELDIDTERSKPVTTLADVDRVAAAATRVVSAPVTLTRRDQTLALEPETLADLYVVQGPDAKSSGSPLQLKISRDAVADVFDDEVTERFSREPRDATVVLTSGGPTVEDSANGFAVDIGKATATIDDLARAEANGDARSDRLPGTVVKPERTTKDARDLQITEKVSSFTTEHQCCQGRVTNIHRFADLIDGAVIDPGDTFSLNEAVGERTRAKGFVGGGAIQEGEYVDEVGGGISQFATTFFNAAFFGGYEIVEHKPHSYYISRYPIGRESTINYPNVDVKITNDSPYGLLIDTGYSDTSITVTFWGRKWADVSSTTGQPFNTTTPEVEVRDATDLPAGEKRVIQSGGNGFDIVVTRTIGYRKGGSDREELFTRYLAEPRIIERGRDDGET